MPAEGLVCVSEKELNPQVDYEHHIHHAIEGDPDVCFLHASKCQQLAAASCPAAPHLHKSRYNVLCHHVSGCRSVISSL